MIITNRTFRICVVRRIAASHPILCRSCLRMRRRNQPRRENKHKWYKKGQAGVKHVRSCFGHACASYGVRHRTWTVRGPRSGGIQVVKGNTCKMDVIDARGMIHFANPDVVSFVLWQIWSMAMLVPAFARTVSKRRVESNTFHLESV